MKLDCSKKILDLSGKTVMVDQKAENRNGVMVLIGGRVLTIGEILATILSQEKVTQFNALKAWSLAQRFYSQKVIEIDDADYSALREMIETSERPPMITGQILQYLISLKETIKSKE